MVSTVSLNEIEEMIEQLSRRERLLLIEWLARRLREEAPETPAERGARLLEQSLLEQPKITAAWEKVMKELGISGEPIGAEEVQKMFLECGINPEDNEFSRGIIEMREE